MGGIMGGSKSGGGSGAITGAAQGVADAAQQGGQQNAAVYRQLGNQLYDNINAAAGTGAAGQLQGAQTSAASQQQARDYLMQQDALPAGLREKALTSLGGLYNGSGSITDRAMASPLYQAAVQQGENSVLRNASATGGLRSGSTSENLAQVNQNALIAAYNDQVQGLQGLGSLQSNANNIAGLTAGIGNTLGQGQINSANTLGQGQVAASQNYANYWGQGAQAITDANNAAAQAMSQGQIAAAQNKAQGAQNSTNNTMQLVGLGLTAASMFSDRRLKSNIRYTGDERGIRKYSWAWNKLANALGLHGHGHGVMADEVEESHPDAVSTKDGYLIVDYSKLGVSYGI